MSGAATTYLLIDGENIDSTLGNSILGMRPTPEQRPRWDTVRSYAAEHWEAEPKALFFLNASSGSLPMAFVQALHAMDYQVVPLAGAPGEKVVDIAILRTLEVLRERPGNVLLASHDGDFAEALLALAGGDRRVGVLGFQEFVSSSFREADLVEILDLENDVHAFSVALPRLRIIPISEFDPAQFL